jgi:hypothetical protein
MEFNQRKLMDQSDSVDGRTLEERMFFFRLGQRDSFPVGVFIGIVITLAGLALAARIAL